MVVAVNSKYRKMIKQVTPQPTTTTLAWALFAHQGPKSA